MWAVHLAQAIDLLGRLDGLVNNAGANDSERRKAEFAKHHRVAKGHVYKQAEHVANHDDVSTADAGEVRRDAYLGQRDEHVDRWCVLGDVEHVVRNLDEAGKMVGGWRRKANEAGWSSV